MFPFDDVIMENHFQEYILMIVYMDPSRYTDTVLQVSLWLSTKYFLTDILEIKIEVSHSVGDNFLLGSYIFVLSTHINLV